jgi:hypothetical protein
MCGYCGHNNAANPTVGQIAAFDINSPLRQGTQLLQVAMRLPPRTKPSVSSKTDVKDKSNELRPVSEIEQKYPHKDGWRVLAKVRR